MTRMHKYFLPALVFACSIPALSACSLHEETKFTQDKVQVKQDRFVEEFPVSSLDEEAVRGVGAYYGRYGDGPVELTVTYDPTASNNTAMMAGNTASRLVAAFRARGMKTVKANILPVKDSGSESRAIVSFASYTAQAPEDCDFMPGVRDKTVEADADYKLGCSMETVYAKQIARPKDLLGHEERSRMTDGRRSSNIVEGYRTGVPNKPLEGESASGD